MFSIGRNIVDLTALKEAISLLRVRLEKLNHIQFTPEDGKIATPVRNISWHRKPRDGSSLYQMDMDAIRRAIMSPVESRYNATMPVGSLHYIRHNMSPVIRPLLFGNSSVTSANNSLERCYVAVAYHKILKIKAVSGVKYKIGCLYVHFTGLYNLSNAERLLRHIKEGRHQSKSFVDDKGAFMLLVLDEMMICPSLLRCGVLNIRSGARLFGRFWYRLHYSPLCPELKNAVRIIDCHIYRNDMIEPSRLINEDDGSYLNANSFVTCPSCSAILAS